MTLPIETSSSKSKVGSRSLRILYILYIALVLLLPELGARVLAKWSHASGAESVFVAISRNYPLTDQLIQDWNTMQFGYHDYYLYSPQPSSSPTINFTDYYGARATPASVAARHSQEVIWAFGGSTMQNLEADDEFTLANRVVEALNQRDVPTRLYNFGVGAFQSSLETIKFQDLLRRTPPDERPTTVLFYDGFNDSLFAYLYGAGNFQEDTSSKLRDVVERRHLRKLLYSGSELMARYSVFWRDYMRGRVESKLHARGHRDAGEDNLRKAVHSYTTNVHVTKGICHELHIRCLFFLQPLIITKGHLTDIEAKVFDSLDKPLVEFGRSFYARAAEALVNESTFHDLSHIFDDERDSIFFDYGHTSPFAGSVVGKVIAAHVMTARAHPDRSR